MRANDPSPSGGFARVEPQAFARRYFKLLIWLMFFANPEILPFAARSEPNVKQRLLGKT